MVFLKLFLHISVIVILTILTQVGGLIWLLSIWISNKFKSRKRYVFPILYVIFNLMIIPPMAKYFGREALPVFSKNIKPRNIFYSLLFRNYVDPELKMLLIQSSKALKSKDIYIIYLDANFPFYDGFPLAPHLSHNDGKKIDISLMYLNKDGLPTNKKPSISGYGVYVDVENKTSHYCKNKGYWQYDFPKYLTFGRINNLEFDKNNTRILILELFGHSKTQKIFIEPYLKIALGLKNENRIRFHGCQAVRHDDHIHMQIN